MANKNCSACDDLRQDAPNFMLNGLGDTECTSLQNNTGLNPSSGNDDCTDLHNMNDCLVGNMDAEIDAYEVCDWKTYMHKFVPNVWTTLKGIICAICGLWKRVEKHDCQLSSLYNGKSWTIGESTTGDTYAVAGKGVSFLKASGSDQHTVDLRLQYIAGGLARGVGSFKFHRSNFTDLAAVGNYDNGETMTVSKNRSGNSRWGDDPAEVQGGELICEFRLKRSAIPQIRSFFSGFGQETGGGSYHVRFIAFTEGSYAWGQHGWCNEDDGTPTKSEYDAGHLVPSGWVYAQLRLTSAMQWSTSEGQQYSPGYFFGIRMNADEIEC